MNKRNGFTLVELLAVIVILAIILIIAVPGVLSIINKTKDNAYDRQVDMIKEAARNYVTANAITWNGDNPKSTLVTLDMLQSGGYLDKKIVDPRNKQEILCANVLVTKDNKNKISYDVDMECNEIQPIHPRIGSGMIPIVYQGNKWVKADSSNKSFAWFNYGDQQWANVATVTEDVRQILLDAPVGTEVPMDKINTMFTWIPRFKYKLFNVDGTASPVGNKNLAGDYMIDIQFETASMTKSTGTKNGEWLTHPAFTFGGQELEGFWMAKFETGYAGALSITGARKNTVEPNKIIIKPNSYSWNAIQLVNMYNMVSKIKENTSLFGLTTVEDPHLVKNIEWGALVYLTQSKYGKQGNPVYIGSEKQVRINNNQNHLTGCGASIQDEEQSQICNTYETANGMSASTTGNITGIYDTSGGAWDFVTGSMKSTDETNYLLGSSGFTQTQLNHILDQTSYFDSYVYESNNMNRSHGHVGDATLEMGPFDEIYDAWYRDQSIFITPTTPFIIRGGIQNQTERSGVTAYSSWAGDVSYWVGYRLITI